MTIHTEVTLFLSQHLVVANGGLGNGVCRELLLEVLSGVGTVESLLMPPNKPYAFVTYQSSDCAQRAHALLNGQQLQCQGQVVTLYLSFVERGECQQQWVVIHPLSKDTTVTASIVEKQNAPLVGLSLAELSRIHTNTLLELLMVI